MIDNKNLNIAEVLSKGEIVITGFSGTSMLPLLRSGKDKVVIEKVTEKPKCNDVPLYMSGGKYVLHRIVKIKPQGYIIRGDHLYRNGKFFSCKSLKYKLYVIYIRVSYPLRYVFIKVIRPILSKLKKCLKK